MGSNPVLSASEPDNFFSGHRRDSKEAHFAGSFVEKTTTMRRTNRHLFRPVRALSARFLRPMIRQWLFPMHIEEMLASLQRTFSSMTRPDNLTPRELENFIAAQCCAATSIAPPSRSPAEGLWGCDGIHRDAPLVVSTLPLMCDHSRFGRGRFERMGRNRPA